MRVHAKIGESGRGLVLLLLAQTGGVQLRRRRTRLAHLALDRGELHRGGVLEGRPRPLVEEVLQQRLRLLQLPCPGQRLGAPEQRLVDQLAVAVALHEGGKSLGRGLVLALVQRGLRRLELGPSGFLVGHLAPVHHHGAGGAAGEQHEQDGRNDVHPLHGEVPCTAFRFRAQVQSSCT